LEVGQGDVARVDKVLDDVRDPGDVVAHAEHYAEDGVRLLAVDGVARADGARAEAVLVGAADGALGFGFGDGICGGVSFRLGIGGY
jgi:hypothetical protein